MRYRQNYQLGGSYGDGAAVLACGQGSGGPSEATKAKTPASVGVPKPYEAQDFGKLKGMAGFSDKLLDMHFTLYQGYVKNTNLLLEQLQQLAAQNQTGSPAYAELKRRFGWEFDGCASMSSISATWGARNPWPKTASS